MTFGLKGKELRIILPLNVAQNGPQNYIPPSGPQYIPDYRANKVNKVLARQAELSPNFSFVPKRKTLFTCSSVPLNMYPLF